LQTENKKSIFVCKAVSYIHETTLLSFTEADFLYCKQMADGYAYVLHYTSTQKKLSYVEKRIDDLDNDLKARHNLRGTSFHSITSEGSCKVLSFGVEERVNNPLYREIFNVSLPKVLGFYPLQDGAKRVSLRSLEEADRAQARIREIEDLLVQQHVMEEDPDAFGGSSALDSGSKMVMAVAGESTIMATGSSTSTTVVETLGASQSHYALEEKDTIETSADDASSAGATMMAIKRPSVSDNAVDTGDANHVQVEQELITMKLAVEEAMSANAVMEQELVIIKQELLASKTLTTEATASKDEAIKKLDSYKAASNVAIAAERRRASGEEVKRALAEAHKQAAEDAMKQFIDKAKRSQEVLKSNLEAEKKQALQQMNQQHEKSVSAKVAAKTKTALERMRTEHDAEMAQQKNDMLRDADAMVIPLSAKVRAQEVELVQLKAMGVGGGESAGGQVVGNAYGVDPSPQDPQTLTADEIIVMEVNAARLQSELSDALQRVEGGNASLEEEKKRYVQLSASLDRQTKTAVEKERREGGAKMEGLKKEHKRQFAGAKREYETWMQVQSEKFTLELAKMRTKAEERDVEWYEKLEETKEDFENDMLPIHLKASQSDKYALEVAKLRTEAKEREKDLDTIFDEKEELEKELIDFRQKAALSLPPATDDVSAVEGLMAAVAVSTDEQAGDGVIPTTMPLECHNRLIASERLRFTHEAQCRAETARLLELERAKVCELEEKISAGLETLSNGALSAAKLQAGEAGKKAKQQTARAVKAELETKEVTKAMDGRLEGAKAMMGDVYQSLECETKAKRAVHLKLLNMERLKKVADMKVTNALESERIAWGEVAFLKERIERISQGGGHASPSPSDLEKALAAAEDKLRSETSLRRELEINLGNLQLSCDASKGKMEQLQEALGEVERRAEGMSSMMRSGPFRFGGW